MESVVTGRLDAVGGGLGVQYDYNDHFSLFSSGYRGFSVPDPGGHLRNDLRTEHAISLETGARYDTRHGFASEAILFHTRFRDLIVPGNAGGAEVESVFSGAQKGNRVPYVPEYQITLGAGIEYSRYGLYLTGTYVPWTFATGNNSFGQVRPDGTPDARFGRTDSAFLLDLTVRAQVTEHAKLFAGVRNLTDRHYIASRVPHGPRPGSPRLFHAGLELSF